MLLLLYATIPCLEAYIVLKLHLYNLQHLMLDLSVLTVTQPLISCRIYPNTSSIT